MTQLKQERIKSGDKTFLINVWGTREQIKNLPKIGSVFAVPIVHAMQALSIFDKDSTKEVTSDQYNILPTALQILLDQLEDEGTEEFFDLILSGVRYQTESVDLDTFDDISQLLEVTGKVLEANYKSLFTGKGLSGFLQMAVPLAQQNLPSKQQ